MMLRGRKTPLCGIRHENLECHNQFNIISSMRLPSHQYRLKEHEPDLTRKVHPKMYMVHMVFWFHKKNPNIFWHHPVLYHCIFICWTISRLSIDWVGILNAGYIMITLTPEQFQYIFRCFMNANPIILWIGWTRAHVNIIVRNTRSYIHLCNKHVFLCGNCFKIR